MPFRGDIEGLRAVAVLLVFASHLELKGFSGGFIGVDIFFVISGFLITGLLLAEHQRRLEDGAPGGFSIPAFYLRRVKRILPAAGVVIAATLVAADELWNLLRASRVRSDAWWAMSSAANINEMRKATDYFQAALPHSPLQHYWSLAVEEQFYLVWPFILLAALRLRVPVLQDWRGRVMWVLAAIWVLSLLFSVTYTESSPSSAYFHPFARAFELATGAILATALTYPCVTRLLADSRMAASLMAAGLVAIVYCSANFGPEVAFPGVAALAPAVASACVIASGQVQGKAHLLALDNSLMRFIGRISYSLYLWHWPVILLLPSALATSDSAANKSAAFCLAMGLSVVSFYSVERPIRRLGTRAHISTIVEKVG